MKTLQRETEARRNRLEPIHLVRLRQWIDRLNPQETTGWKRDHYWSDRPLNYGYRDSTLKPFDGRLVNLAVVDNGFDHLADPRIALGLVKRVTITVANHPLASGETLIESLRNQWPLTGASVEVSQLLVAPGEDLADIEALPADSHEVWLRGEVIGIGNESLETFELFVESRALASDQDFFGTLQTDAASVDPRDLGKRLPIVFGRSQASPCVGVDVPGYSTLAAAIDANTTTIELTDASQFATSPGSDYRVLIGDEVIDYTGISESSLTGVTRGVDPGTDEGTVTAAVAHGAGETVIELGADDTVWKWKCGEEADEVSKLWIRNGIADDVLVPAGPFWVLPTTENGNGPEIQITGANLRQELRAQVTQGIALTSQPTDATVMSHTDTNESPSSATGEVPSQTIPNTVDGDTGTFEFIGSGGSNSDYFIWTFTNSQPATSPVISHTFELYWVSATGSNERLIVYAGDIFNDPDNATQLAFMDEGPPATHPDGWNSWSAPLNVTKFSATAGDPGVHLSAVYEVRRTITFDTSTGGSIETEAAAAVSVGKGLQLYADVDWHTKTAADTTAKRYPNTEESAAVEKFTDSLRGVLDTRLGVDVDLDSDGGQLDDTSWGIVDAALDRTKTGGTMDLLGRTAEEAIGRLCWEHAVQLALTEDVDKTLWKIHAARRLMPGSYIWPATTRVISDWSDLKARYPSGADVFSSAQFLYRFDNGSGAGDIEGFRAQISSSSSATDNGLRGVQGVGVYPDDRIPRTADEYVNEERHADAERRIGRRVADDLFGFLTIADDTTAKETAAYYTLEGMRDDARIYDVSGVPWIYAYDLEAGDLVYLEHPRWITTGRVHDRLSSGDAVLLYDNQDPRELAVDAVRDPDSPDRLRGYVSELLAGTGDHVYVGYDSLTAAEAIFLPMDPELAVYAAKRVGWDVSKDTELTVDVWADDAGTISDLTHLYFELVSEQQTYTRQAFGQVDGPADWSTYSASGVSFTSLVDSVIDPTLQLVGVTIDTSVETASTVRIVYTLQTGSPDLENDDWSDGTLFELIFEPSAPGPRHISGFTVKVGDSAPPSNPTWTVEWDVSGFAVGDQEVRFLFSTDNATTTSGTVDLPNVVAVEIAFTMTGAGTNLAACRIGFQRDVGRYAGAKWEITSPGLAAASWVPQTIDLAAPTLSYGPGGLAADRVTEFRFGGLFATSSATNDLAFSTVRGDYLGRKCRVIRTSKRWGFGGDMADLTLVEVE